MIKPVIQHVNVPSSSIPVNHVLSNYIEEKSISYNDDLSNNDESDEQVIEALEGRRINAESGLLELYMKWRNLPSRNTWELFGFVKKNAPEILAAFEQELIDMELIGVGDSATSRTAITQKTSFLINEKI